MMKPPSGKHDVLSIKITSAYKIEGCELGEIKNALSFRTRADPPTLFMHTLLL